MGRGGEQVHTSWLDQGTRTDSWSHALRRVKPRGKRPAYSGSPMSDACSPGEVGAISCPVALGIVEKAFRYSTVRIVDHS